MSRATGAGPLAGRTIVVTRAAAQARRFVELLESAGARVVHAPTIVIEPPPSWEPLDGALAALDTFGWVVFTSVNGVTMVDRRLRACGLTWTAVARRRVAAIGPATADALVERGVPVEVMPSEYRAEALVERLGPLLAPGDRLLLPRAKLTRDVLVVELRRLGVDVHEVPAYQTRRVDDGAEHLREALLSGGVDAVTFTSSSTARNFAEMFTAEERRRWRDRVAVASIGPITAATAAEYGLETAVMPREYTIPALAKAIEDYFSRVPPERGQRGQRSQ